MNEKDKMSAFLKHHNACIEGYKWAVENCESLNDVWQTAKPEWRVWVATRPGVLTDRDLHEFGLFAANQVRYLMTDPRSIAALDAKRKWLDGEITDDELRRVWMAAEAARAVAARAATAAAAAEAKQTENQKQRNWLIENTKPCWDR